MQDALTKLGARASSLEEDLAKAKLQISSGEVLIRIRMRMLHTIDMKTKNLKGRHKQCTQLCTDVLSTQLCTEALSTTLLVLQYN